MISALKKFVYVNYCLTYHSLICHDYFYSNFSIFSRIGGIDEGANQSGSVQGAKGVYSSSAANIDSTGKGSYKVSAGKIP